MDEVRLIKICLQLVTQKLEWRVSSEWTDFDYKKLRQLIFDASGINISTHTLKRLFGKIQYKKEYNPQLATKNALSIFIGYKNWEDFSKAHHNLNRESAPKEKKKLPGKKLLIFGSIGILFILVGSLVTVYRQHIKSNKKYNFTFYTEKKAESIPFTIPYHYDISKLKTDKVFLDFGYSILSDKQRFSLDKTRNNFNHCFQIPGWYKVSLIADQDTLKSIYTHVLSDDWVTYITDNINPNPWLDNMLTDNKQNGFLRITPRQAFTCGIDTTSTYRVTHMLIKEFEIPADELTFEVRFRNSSEDGGLTCYDSQFELIGENKRATITFVEEGCYRYANFVFSDVKKMGEYDDLSAFSQEITQWSTLKIKVADMNSEILFNDKTIYHCQYNTPLGRLKGILLTFKGSGTVDYVRLYNRNNELVYSDDF
ncbi:hypothetical protein [Mariniphaga sediminis]|uniref:hypothetical protein n=1 Tax=Mariniphaga sediminis TaxID=1628158 RepID=UPI0035679679